MKDMKINAKDSFFESLERLSAYEAWHNRLWRAVTGDLWKFFKNVWAFRRELWEHRWWDYRFTIIMLRRSLVIMEKGMHDGMEIRETRDKKIEKMKRAIQILNNISDDSYISMAEKELGNLVMKPMEFIPLEENPELYEMVDNETPEEAEHNRKIFKRSTELEQQEWQELWQIFQGQDYDKFNKEEDWNEQFDGSGLKGWWD
jgi:hypothetical protein